MPPLLESLQSLLPASAPGVSFVKLDGIFWHSEIQISLVRRTPEWPWLEILEPYAGLYVEGKGHSMMFWPGYCALSFIPKYLKFKYRFVFHISLIYVI